MKKLYQGREQKQLNIENIHFGLEYMNIMRKTKNPHIVKVVPALSQIDGQLSNILQISFVGPSLKSNEGLRVELLSKIRLSKQMSSIEVTSLQHSTSFIVRLF
ncbi:hypothetical protein I3843_14G050500 [Carya illinoinensis]|nr:hypothetical protein I3760_14G050700 [Carya illinoinensis]KAG7946637.1 hypothetical protein I3843_14G050500 [Carya illinoinensis]